jgi:hypothetical protein
MPLFTHNILQGGTWASWSKYPTPVFEGNFTASDPSVIQLADRYYMTYTDLDTTTMRTTINGALSDDGIAWNLITGSNPSGLLLSGKDGDWDENLESSSITFANGVFYLYYSGYKNVGTPVKGFPAALGMATSDDGVRFTKVRNDPIMSPTTGWYDNDAVYSPSVRRFGPVWNMTYVGHSYTDFSLIHSPGVVLLNATSSDGVNWIKNAKPVLTSRASPAWLSNGVAEPDMIRGPDDKFYLFFTGIQNASRVIGSAWSSTPMGPWVINPNPVIRSGTQGKLMLAPTVLIGSDAIARMWFLEQDIASQRIRIDHALAILPLVK